MRDKETAKDGIMMMMMMDNAKSGSEETSPASVLTWLPTLIARPYDLRSIAHLSELRGRERSALAYTAMRFLVGNEGQSKSGLADERQLPRPLNLRW